MRINSLQISGIGGIRELLLNFNPGFNAICGPNGIGKTTILKTIVNAFGTNSTLLKRNAEYDEGKYEIQYLQKNGTVIDKEYKISEFEPQKRGIGSHVNDCTPYIMNFRENRSIEYTNLTAIPKDPDANKYQVGSDLELGISIDDMKGWFDNRCNPVLYDE